MPFPDRAIILAAGKGGRLLPDTLDRPKALLTLDSETILECQIRLLRGAGVESIAVVTGHGDELVRQPLEKRSSIFITSAIAKPIASTPCGLPQSSGAADA